MFLLAWSDTVVDIGVTASFTALASVPGSAVLGWGWGTVFAGAWVFFAVDVESNKPPDFSVPNEEDELFEEPDEDADFEEDPTDPLLLLGQPASSFTRGRKAIAEKSSVINVFFINITVIG